MTPLWKCDTATWKTLKWCDFKKIIPSRRRQADRGILGQYLFVSIFLPLTRCNLGYVETNLKKSGPIFVKVVCSLLSLANSPLNGQVILDLLKGENPFTWEGFDLPALTSPVRARILQLLLFLITPSALPPVIRQSWFKISAALRLTYSYSPLQMQTLCSSLQEAQN